MVFWMIRRELQVAAISLAQVTDSSVRNGSFAKILPDLFILLNIGMLMLNREIILYLLDTEEDGHGTSNCRRSKRTNCNH